MYCGNSKKHVIYLQLQYKDRGSKQVPQGNSAYESPVTDLDFLVTLTQTMLLSWPNFDDLLSLDTQEGG